MSISQILSSIKRAVLAGHSEATTRKKGFRADVEGLRAVAVGAVLLYHAGVPFAGGGYVGVDVFFVISGFLITGLLVRELEKTGRISLTRFYSRRAKRLLPMTLLVLATTAVLSWAIFSPVRQGEVATDIIASSLYVVNWLLAHQAVDYFAAGLQTSPVQHFWSLAVEEQFYLVWPALLLGVAWWCRRQNLPLRPPLGAVFAIVALASFAYSIYLTRAEAGAAYFSTLTRIWELALGGGLALLPLSRLRMPGPTAAALAWAGVGAIAIATIKLSDDTSFPGIAALLPTLGTAAIIAAGSGGRGTGLLTLGPVRHVGRISYSWYLWHWPLLVFAAALWGDLTAVEGLGVVAVSYVVTVTTHYLVERPFLHAPALTQFPRRALGIGGACTLSSVALGALLFVTAPEPPEAPESQVVGATVAEDGNTPKQKSASTLRPTPREAKDDRGKMQADGCLIGREQTESPGCVYGNPDSQTTVVLFGDSHAMQYFPALDRLAKERDWRLVGLTKSGCPPADVASYNPSFGREFTECEQWRDNTLKRISDEDPDLIVTSSQAVYSVMEGGERLGSAANTKAMVEGYTRTLKRLKETGAEVAVIKDNPHPDGDVPDCISGSLDELDKCALPRDEALGYPAVNKMAAEEVNGVKLVDPTPVLCQEESCPAVMGNVIVYRNGMHLTATYVRTLAPWLGRQLPEFEDS